MIYAETKSYDYEFYWVEFKGKITIAELRTPYFPHTKRYYLTGEGFSASEDELKVLRRIDDYQTLLEKKV